MQLIKFFNKSLPINPESSNSHLDLEPIGFTVLDVIEVRFFCSTTHNKQFMHFVSKNPKIAAIALSGSQESAFVK